MDNIDSWPHTVFPMNLNGGEWAAPVRTSNGFVEDFYEVGDFFQCLDWEIRDFYDLDWVKVDKGEGPCEPDVIDLLPSDPFGMDCSAATFTAVAEWIRDFGAGAEDPGSGSEGGFSIKGDCQLFAGLNLLWNNAMLFELDPGAAGVNEIFNSSYRFDGLQKEAIDGPCEGELVPVLSAEEILNFSDEDATRDRQVEDMQECTKSSSHGDDEAPNDAFFYVLGYLGISDLLSAGRVCKSLRSAVKTDPLLWRNIHVDHPLNMRMTDDTLLELTAKAQGSLQCLSLVTCHWITNNGLKRVLESNPKLTKLGVLGCPRITIDGLINNLRDFKTSGKSGIKCLQIGAIYGLTNQHYEELKFLLEADKCERYMDRKARFYHMSYSSPSFHDECLDVEICPRCQNSRLVYDCPAESCQGRKPASQLCRACIICIRRCTQCGRCINGNDYEENFCFEMLCPDCWKQLFHSPERQETRYHVHVYC